MINRDYTYDDFLRDLEKEDRYDDDYKWRLADEKYEEEKINE